MVVARDGVAVYRMAGVPKKCLARGKRFTLRVSAVRRSSSSGFRKVARVDFWGAGKRIRRDTAAPFTQTLVILATARKGATIPVSTQVFVKTKKGTTVKKWIRTTVKVCA